MLDRTIVRGVVLALVCAMLGAGLARADALKSVNVQAGNLVDALELLARQCGVYVMYPGDKLAGFKTAGVSGTLRTTEAFERLIEGTPLVIQEEDGGVVISLLQSSAAPSDAASRASDAPGEALRLARAFPSSQAQQQDAGAPAQGSSSDPQSGEPAQSNDIQTVSVFGTLEDEIGIGSKTGLSLRETPKSVTLMTRERLEAQNLTTLEEALVQTTGVTLVSYSSVSTVFLSRGFIMQSMQFDGGAPAYAQGFGRSFTPDTTVYDHIEVLRGVDGMYSGAGEPGGIVNFVRKRAKATPQVQLNLSGGSWNNYRGELDVTGALTDDGRLRGRLVGAYQDKDYFYDRAGSKKTVFFGTAEYDLTDRAVLIAGATYERRKEDGYFTWGFPRFTDGRDLGLPTHTAFNPRWAHWYSTNKEAFLRAEQKYGASGLLKFSLTRTESDSENRQFINTGAVDPVTGIGNYSRGSGNEYHISQNLIDLSANGTFTLFGREHRYTLGADYSENDGGGRKSYRLEGYVWPGRPIDVFHFDPDFYPEPVATQTAFYPKDGQTQRGFYATLGLQLAQPLRLTLGGRYGEYRYENIWQGTAPDGSFVGDPFPTRYKDSQFIPSVALSLDLASNWTAYVSYAETFRPQASLLSAPLPGTPLDPITGGGAEVGIKGEVLQRLNASLAVYRIKRKGEATFDPAFPYTPGDDGSECCYLPLSDATSEGFDAEVSGTLKPGWQMFGGYTYHTSRLTGIPEGEWSERGYHLNLTPKHMFKMWTTYQLPGELRRWTLNAGVVIQTKSFQAGTALAAPGSDEFIRYAFTQGGYAVWNASAQYRLSDAWSIGLYGDNLSNKTYYQTVGYLDAENVYGAPRSYTLTVRGRW